MNTTNTVPAVRIPADLSVPVSVVGLDASYPLASMYEHLNCAVVEPVVIAMPIIHNALIWVDEGGLCKNAPRFNTRASIICNRPLFGDAILAGDDGEKIVALEMTTCPKSFFEVLQDEARIFVEGGVPTA